MKNVLIIAPHPDDEVLGAGGVLARLAASDADCRINILYVTRRSTPIWKTEQVELQEQSFKNIVKLLGAQKYCLDYPDIGLEQVPHRQLNDSIAHVVRQVQPTTAFIPHRGDLNLDHRIVAESSLVALRPKVYPVRRILSYEVLSTTEKSISPFEPNVFYDISDFMNRKIELCETYLSEINNGDPDRTSENIRAVARNRGIAAGCKFAEAFQLIRERNC